MISINEVLLCSEVFAVNASLCVTAGEAIEHMLMHWKPFIYAGVCKGRGKKTV